MDSQGGGDNFSVVSRASPGQEVAAVGVEADEDDAEAVPDFDSELDPDELDPDSDPGLGLPFEPDSDLPFEPDSAPLLARLSVR